MSLRFSRHIEERAHRTTGGEYAWQRDDAITAVREIASSGLAVLGGELWAVRAGRIWGGLQLTSGQTGIFHWESERRDGESWDSYVVRSAVEAERAILGMPGTEEVVLPEGATIYYNLAWSKGS